MDLDGIALIDVNNTPMVFYAVTTGLLVAVRPSSSSPFTATTITSDIRTPNQNVEQGISAAIVNDVPSVVFINSSRNVIVAQQISGAWTTLSVHETGQAVGTPEIIDRGGSIGVAFVEQVNSLFRLVYKEYDGSNWRQFDTGAGVTTINSNIGLASIGNRPAITYMVAQSTSGIADIRYTRYDGTAFQDEIIESDVAVSALPKMDMMVWNREAFISVSNNPFRVYYYNQKVSSTTGIKPTYFCECASHIFLDRLTHLDELARWRSSAFGHTDTRVSETTHDSMRPNIRTRSTGAAVILWDEGGDNPQVRGSTFRVDTQNQLRSSGTQSWFDYNFDISGRDVALDVDMLDRTVIVFETPDPVSTEGFHGQGQSPNEIPSNSIYYKNCDFDEEAEGLISRTEPCDVSDLKTNIITSDPFLISSIIKKIKIKDRFVEYYTYNVAEQIVPVVSSCNVILEIVGSPEIVAFRLKNENSSDYPSWCPWSPKVGDYQTEIDWSFSPERGVKEVCIQAITYSGVTAEFCLPVIGDYSPVIFEVTFFADEEYAEKLPSFEGMAIASTGENPDSRQRTIFVEILPSVPLSVEIIKFDVFQQGINDKFEQTATKVEGENVYRGSFIVETEDKIRNIDGLARIRPRFPDVCEDIETSATDSDFQKDKYNVMTKDAAAVVDSREDTLAQYRQAVSGRIGVDITVRGTEDPYFVFGDPSWMLQRKDGRQFPAGTDTGFLKSNLDFVAPEVSEGADEDEEGEEGDGAPGG